MTDTLAFGGLDAFDDGARVEGKRDRLARLLSVLRILQAHGDAGISPAEIARRTGMSKRSIYRDLDALERDAGPAVERPRQVGRPAAAPSCRPLRLTLPEAMAVFLSARLVTRYADKYEPNLASAFGKIGEALPDALREHVERTLDDLAQRRVDPDFNRHVTDLTRAWAERRVVRFRYQPARYDGTEREARVAEVEPYLLEPSLATHALYLIGLDRTRGAIRTFKVERIVDLSLTPEAFEAPEAVALATTLRAGLGHHRGPARDRGRAALRAGGRRARRRGDVAPEPGRPGAGRRVARVARARRGHDRDPALDPVLGRRGGGAGARRAARRRRRHARPRGRPLCPAAPDDRRPGPASGRRLPFAAVNLISDPIHGYVELTKRLDARRCAGRGPRAGGRRRGRPARHGLGPAAAADQPAPERALGVPDRRALPVHARPGRDARGGPVGALALPVACGPRCRRSAPGEPVPSEGLVVETLRIAGLLHDVGHGPFAHFFDERFLAAFPAPADPRRPGAKTLSHEDLSQLIIERELGPLIRGLRRAPGAVAERDRFADGEAIDPRWVSFLISKPPLVDPAMPAWVRALQPLLSGVFTVDNLDYVRRDAYLTGVSMGPVDAERLRRYTFVSERGLTLYESGVGALEMFLTARLFMYQHVYLHRTVRAIDLDLEEVFAPSILAVFGDGSPAERLGAFADLDEYALLHQAAGWARGEHLSARPVAGRRHGDAARSPTAGGRSCSAGRGGTPSARSAPSPRPATGRRPCSRSWARPRTDASPST